MSSLTRVNTQLPDPLPTYCRERQAVDLLHTRYSEPRDNVRPAAMRTLFGITRRHRDMHLFTLIRSIELTPRRDAATAVVFVAITGVSVESVEALDKAESGFVSL